MAGPMYSSFEAFRRDAETCGPAYYTDASLTPRKLEAAYTLYKRAAAGTSLGMTIVGRLALRADDGAWIPSNEEFPSIDEILEQNLGTLGEGEGQKGSVLRAADWSLLGNDAWLLGGIHAETEFHFASPLRWENLWSAAANRMTVTAREAICITSSGYEIMRPNPKLEAVAVCAERAGAAAATLLTLKAAVLSRSGLDGLREFYRQIFPIGFG